MTSLIPAWLPEYDALQSTAGLVDLSDRSKVRVTGEDAVQFLNSFCTNDVKSLSPGQGCEAFLTNHQGKTVGHVFVRVEANTLLLDAAPQQAATIISHLNRFVISDRVEFEDASSQIPSLLLTGPSAAGILQQLTENESPERLWDHRDVQLAGTAVNIQRADYLGPNSFLLTLARDDFQIVRAAMEVTGATLVSSEAAEAMRLESGTPFFGLDISPENLPQEIGRDKQAISFKKGCYLGQETVARIDALGHVNRLLSAVKLSSGQIPAAGMPLTAEGKPVGHITSASWSPKLRTPLALAMIRRTAAKAGTTLMCEGATAEVISVPLA